MRTRPLQPGEIEKAREQAVRLVNGLAFPIDLHAVAAEMGIDVVMRDIGKIDAFIFRDDDEYVAVVNSRQRPQRQRFSLAHEIGHVLVGLAINDPEFRNTNDCAIARNNEIEKACNEVACELLMPRDAFRLGCDYHGWNIGGALRMAEIFDVSLESSIRRCVDVAEIDLIMAKWKIDSWKLDCQYGHSKDMYVRRATCRSSTAIHPNTSWSTFVDYEVGVKEGRLLVRTQDKNVAVRKRSSRKFVQRTLSDVPTEFRSFGPSFAYSLACPLANSAL